MAELETRPCAPEDVQAWKDFLDKNFGYHRPQTYGVDFAPLFAATALARTRLVWRGPSIVASGALHPVSVVTPRQRIKLGIVGAVATAESFRGKGVSSQVLKELESMARMGEMGGLVLWSDQETFYAKADFTPVGIQHIYSLQNLPSPQSLANGTPSVGWDVPQVRALYEKHALRCDRSAAYWAAIEEIKSCNRLQWVDEEGKVRAYVGLDRGRDMQGIIHEWGGEEDALYSLVWTLHQTRPDIFWLTHPKLRDPIRKALGNAEPVVNGSLCLMKSLNENLTLSDFEDVWFWGLDSL